MAEHLSDCAMHNAPAFQPGKCTCLIQRLRELDNGDWHSEKLCKEAGDEIERLHLRVAAAEARVESYKLAAQMCETDAAHAFCNSHGARPGDHVWNFILHWAERAEAELKAAREALREIAKGEGAFSRDPLTHASNTIDNMKSIAVKALKGEDK